MVHSKSYLSTLVAFIVLIGLGCGQRHVDKRDRTPEQLTVADINALATPHFPGDTGMSPAFDANRAMQYVKEIVSFGPRPIGSAAHKKVENYIVSHLRGDIVEDDSFVADTAAGKFPMRNLIAKFPGARPGVIVIASHYDTNYPLRNTTFVGANDGASTSGLLLELANQLRVRKIEGYSVWLVWTDGEEATKSWSDTDSLYGAQHLSTRWGQDGTAQQIKVFLVADMLGDADLDIARDTNSTPWVESVVYEAATRLGYQSHFFVYSTGVSDDHLPFLHLGIPAADIIDIDYGYQNVFHHTTQDTLDKLSIASLEISGKVLLETLAILDKLHSLPPN